MKSLAKFALICSTLAVSAPAWSIPLSSVGNVDALIAQTTLQNSGEGTEIHWIESVLHISLDQLQYTQTDVQANDWQAVDGMTGVFATGLETATEWFLIKIGNNSGASSTHFLFDNVNDLYFAVISLGDMGFNQKNILNIGKISHVGTGPEESRDVPEPGSLALFGLALLGVGVARRHRQSN